MPLQRTRLLPTARAGMLFNGVNQYASITDTPALRITSSVTVSTLVYIISPEPLSTPNSILVKGVYPNRQYDIGIDYSGRRITAGADGIGYMYSAPGSLDQYIGRWVFLTYLRNTDSGVHRIIADTSTIASSTFTPGTQARSDTNPLLIGRYVNMVVSYVLIYSRALADEEITWNYYYPDNPTRNGLVLWLHWDSIDTANNRWYDKSGFGNHATLYNNPEKVDMLLPPKRSLSPVRILSPSR